MTQEGDSGSNAVGNNPQRGSRRVTVPEAARLLGISERAVRWRISANTIPHHREGKRWIIFLPDDLSGSENDAGAVVSAVGGSGAVGNSGSAVVDAVVSAVVDDREGGSKAVEELARQLAHRDEHIRDLERTNMELAGQVGYLQSELQHTQAQVKLLQAPAEDEPIQTISEPRKSLWRRLFGS